ncbi:hypothetical protein GQ457_15G013130 [Hibiscus cannabinus]
MNLNIIVWNVQGCGSMNFIHTTREYVRDHRPDVFVFVFVETRISGTSASKVITSLDFDNSFRIEAAGF